MSNGADVDATTPTVGGGLPFPPVTKSHIRNCAVPSWHARYRTLTPKTRLVPLNEPFLSYLRADGIVLPSDDEPKQTEDDNLDGWDDGDDADEADDPTSGWEDVHAQIKSTIAQLGGRVHPKLNWSAPKDATWIAATNSMDCRSPNDIYLLFKSSDFITHDLQQAYYGCEDGEEARPEDVVDYRLVLRKSVASMVTSMEFRCFVRNRRLIGVCQRDLNHYDFMPSLLPILQDLVYDFFDEKLKDSFPDPNFVFDIYVPQPKETGRVWLIDINPWAPRTDPLLFSWLELLTRPDPAEAPEATSLEEAVVRLQLHINGAAPLREEQIDSGYNTTSGTEDEADYEIDDDEETPSHYPEFRLVKRDDPEAYSFNSPLYSAHKIPKDVVDASMTVDGEGGMRDFMENWQQKVSEMESGRARQYSSDEDE